MNTFDYFFKKNLNLYLIAQTKENIEKHDSSSIEMFNKLKCFNVTVEITILNLLPLSQGLLGNPGAQCVIKVCLIGHLNSQNIHQERI